MAEYIGNIEEKSLSTGLKKDNTEWKRWAFKVVGSEGPKTMSVFEDKGTVDMISSAMKGQTKKFTYTEKENPQGGPTYKTITGISDVEGQAIKEEVIVAPGSAPAQVVQPQKVQAESQQKQPNDYDLYWKEKRVLEKEGASERLLTSCLIQCADGKDLTKEEDLNSVISAVQKMFIGMKKVKTNLQENNTW